MEEKIEFKFVPNEKQALFFESSKKFLLANGGVGSGKSSIIANKALVNSLLFPGTLGLIGRKTYPELRDTTRRTFFDWINRNNMRSIIKKWNQTENHLVWRNGSEILFRALDDIYKLGSLELGWFLIDELSEFEEEDTFKFLRTRLRHPKGPLTGGGATNPATKEHWLYKLFVESQNPDYEVFEVPTYANRENLPPEYIADLEKLPEEWQNRYLQGQWGIVPKGTRVFSKFTPSIHLDNFKYNPYLPILRGWDFGFRHPAVIFAQETDWGRLLFLKELQGTEIQIDDFADVVIRKTNEWFPGCRIEDYCDIAGTHRSDKSKITSVQILKKKGIDASYRKTIDLEKEVSEINNLFEKQIGALPRMGIDRKGCPIFSDALAGGYYRDKEGKPTGDDFFDHLCDAARYIIVNIYVNLGREKRYGATKTYQYPTISEVRA